MMAAILICSWTMADADTVRGRVIDADTGEPLAGATVTVVETAQHSVTTTEGYYTINDIPIGRYTLEARCVGYEPQLQVEVLVAGRSSSAADFQFDSTINAPSSTLNQNDVLVIDQNLKGIDFQLSKCCHPIYGDPVFGFVTAGGGIKIHRTDCPNAPELRKRFGYRIVKAKWSGKGASMYSITLRVVGNDDIGIVNNLTSIISKDERLVLRSINIDSHDGLFSGNLVVMLDDTSRMESLMKKLRTVKGVKQVERI